jgi:hypothetical protein
LSEQRLTREQATGLTCGFHGTPRGLTLQLKEKEHFPYVISHLSFVIGGLNFESRRQEERGQAHLPHPELIGVEIVISP